MRKETVLTYVPCDITRLPLNAFEGYLLSLVDGRLTLEELAEIAGTSVAHVTRHAAHLLDVGAVVVLDAEAPPRRHSSKTAAVKRPSRMTPAPRSARSSPSRRPRRSSGPPHRSPPPVGRTPPPRGPSARPSATRSSPRPAPARAPTPPPAAKEPLDDAVRNRIHELDARLSTVDHYGLLGVDREAEKAEIKRAYFTLAAEFHPDRHFRKQLGEAKAPLQRIFTRLTEAHDALTSRARRAEYDASLPPRPPPPAVAPPPPSKRGATRRSSAHLGAVQAPRAAPPPPERTAPSAPERAAPAARERPAPSAPERAAPARERPAPERAAPARPPPERVLAPADARAAREHAMPASDEALRRLYWSRKQNEVDRRVAVFVAAADAALAREDVVSAAEGYRLALQIKNDPAVRNKLQAIEGRARERVFESSLARARAAERAERWEEAAQQFVVANNAKPEAAVAERAAHAIRMQGGDLHRAAQLAEQAVLAEPKNVGYHVTLGEVCLAAKLFARAAGEAARALAIAPNDARAKALAAAAAKRK